MGMVEGNEHQGEGMTRLREEVPGKPGDGCCVG